MKYNPVYNRHKTGVYSIVNTVNARGYVGSTSNSFRRRWNAHVSDLRKGTHNNLHLQRAWNKYGERAFEFHVIEYVDKPEDCTKVEQFYLDGDNLYNFCRIAGSTLGCRHSDKAKQKMSAKRKGRRVTETTKTRMSMAQKGHSVSQETKQKIRESNLGKPRSIETREKMSKAHIGLGKCWTVEFPDQHKEEIRDLKEFCCEHKLEYRSVLSHKRVKGFKFTTGVKNHVAVL